MVLPAFLKKEELDKLDESDRKHYSADGEGYRLQVTGIKVDDQTFLNLENITGLKKTIGKQKVKLDEVQAILGEFVGEDGETLDPKEVRLAMRAAKSGEGKGGKPLSDDERSLLEKNWTKKIQASEESHAAHVKHLEGQLELALVDANAKAAIAKKGASVKLLLPALRERARMIKEKDPESGFHKYRSQIIGEDGEPAFSMKGSALEEMGWDELVEQVEEDEELGLAFGGSGATGGGAKPTLPNRGPTGGAKPRTISASDHDALYKYQDEIAKGEIEVVAD